MRARATHPTGVKLEPAVKSRLEELGKLKQRSMHWLMKEAISQYLEHEEATEKLKLLVEPVAHNVSGCTKPNM